MIHATAQMNLDIILSERSPTQKASYHTIPFVRDAQNRYIPRDRKQISCCLGLGVGGWGVTANKYKPLFGGDENVLELEILW